MLTYVLETSPPNLTINEARPTFWLLIYVQHITKKVCLTLPILGTYNWDQTFQIGPT